MGTEFAGLASSAADGGGALAAVAALAAGEAVVSEAVVCLKKITGLYNFIFLLAI